MVQSGYVFYLYLELPIVASSPYQLSAYFITYTILHLANQNLPACLCGGVKILFPKKYWILSPFYVLVVRPDHVLLPRAYVVCGK